MDGKKLRRTFVIPEKFRAQEKEFLSGPNGWLLFVACNCGADIASAVRNRYLEFLNHHASRQDEVPIIGSASNPSTRVFSDTETCPRLERNVAGSNAFVFQHIQENISNNTVNENIMQLLQVVRTLRAHRAQNITVVTPYMPYSRQDKPTFKKRESVLARLYADLMKSAGADNYLTYHPHTLNLYGFYEPDIKLVSINGLEMFVDIFRHLKGRKDVIAVSTDSGGAKFTVNFAEALNVSYAIANKYRGKKDSTKFIGIIGDLADKTTAVITDDETVTGGSILNTVRALYTDYGIKEIYVAVSHAKVRKKYIADFIDAHQNFGLREVHITDSVPQIGELLEQDFVKVHSLAPIFAAAINRMHYNMSVSEIFR